MIGRRTLLKATLVAGIGSAGTPLLAACEVHTSRGSGPLDWNANSIPGLDLHFDFTKLDRLTVDSTNFAEVGGSAAERSTLGKGWRTTGETARGPDGLRMVRGNDATTLIDAEPLSATLIRASVMAGRHSANVSLVLCSNDSRQCEIVLQHSREFDSAELRGVPGVNMPFRRTPSHIDLDSMNTIEAKLDATRVQVFVNHAEILDAKLPKGWQLSSYGVGLRHGDTESALHDFVVFEYTDRELHVGDRISAVAQLAQPSAWLVAGQPAEVKMPTLSANSIGNQRVLTFDGRSQNLVTNASADSSSMTIFAVVKRGPAGKGTIIGPTESAGGPQIRIDEDGSVAVLNAGIAGICRSPSGVMGERPAIVAFSMDTVGNAQLYVDGRPVAATHSPVQFPAGVKLAIASAYNSEFFSGDIAEILRWSRPLTGAELRTVFDKLSTKWDIGIAQALDNGVVNPLSARQLKGSNIIPELADLEHDNPRASAWLNLWSRWNWEWLELSVRQAVAQGANTIRLIGDVNAVHGGAIDEATYHDRLQQVISLCAAMNCRFYYCAIDLRHKRDATPEFITRFFSGVATVLARNSNVVAIELCNEVSSGYTLYPEKDVITWMTQWAGVFRANAPKIPLSISDVAPGSLADKIGSVDYYQHYAPIVDFFDLHVYDDLTIGADSQPLAPYQLSVNRCLLIGEFGVDRHEAGAQPAAFYADVKKLRDSSDLVVGALQWGAVNDDFGLYAESDGSLEEDIAAEWATF